MLFLLIPLLALTTYTLHLSYNNITRLQQYEERSEKAAKYSNTVAQRLSKTRKTQTSGTLVVRTPFPFSSFTISPVQVTTNTSI